MAGSGCAGGSSTRRCRSTTPARTSRPISSRSPRTLGCDGPGVGFLTAAPVEAFTTGRDGDVDAYATVGLRHPTWAADAEGAAGGLPVGTINLLVGVPVRLAPAALVNAVMTATEAKSQALVEHGVPGTGTASDAICVVCPATGDTESFAGPRAAIGSRIARAVHAAVGEGTANGWPSEGESES